MDFSKLLLKIKTEPIKVLFILLAVSVPFDHIPSLAYQDIHIRFSVLFGSCLIVAAAASLIRTPSVRKKFRLLHFLLLLWLLWMCAGLIQVHDWHAALKTFLPISFLVLTALSMSLLWRRQYVRPVVNALLLGALLAVAFGFYQFVGNRLGLPSWATGIRMEYSWERFGFPRMQSVALEPLYFSCFLLLPIGLLSSLLIHDRRYRKFRYLGLLGSMLLADFLTLSRGGLAALILLFIFLAVANRNYFSLKRHKKLVLYFVAGVIISFSLSLGIINAVSRNGQDPDLTYNKSGISTFVTHLSNLRFRADDQDKAEKTSIGERDTARSQTIQILSEDHRVLAVGVGPGQYANYLSSHYPYAYGTPNNFALEQLEQTGLVGTLLLVGFFLLLLLRLGKQISRQEGMEKTLCIVLVCYFLAVGAQAQTFSGITLTHLWFAVGLALFLVQLHPSNHKPIKRYATKKIPKSRTRPNR